MKNFFIYDSHESIEERKNVKEFVDMDHIDDAIERMDHAGHDDGSID